MTEVPSAEPDSRPKRSRSQRGRMQRYIARRVLQSFLAIWVMSLIVFCLARLSGNALDVMLPMESTQEDYDRLAKYWGLDQPVHVQYGIFVAPGLQGDFGMSWKWPGHSAMGLPVRSPPRHYPRLVPGRGHHAAGPLLDAGRAGHGVREADPDQGARRVEGRLEALPAECVDRPVDVLRDHRRRLDDGIRRDRERFLLARNRAPGDRRRESSGLPGCPGRRDRVLRHLHHDQPPGRHPLRIPRPENPLPVREGSRWQQ